MYPKIAHYIWLGPNPLPHYAVSNIIHFNATNPLYKINLWAAEPVRLKNNLIEAGYSRLLLRRVNIRPLPRMTAHIRSAVEREMVNSRYGNYAAASDILRLVVLEMYGGIYMDVDVMVSGSLGYISPEAVNSNRPSDLLIHKETLGRTIRTSNAVIISQPRTNRLKTMLYYALTPYINHKIHEMGLGKTAGKDGLSAFLKTPAMRGISLKEVMWVGKRSIPNLRHQITIWLTGPGMIESYIKAAGFSSRFQSSVKMSHPEKFGQRDASPLGNWSRGMNGDGHWVDLKSKRRCSI